MLYSQGMVMCDSAHQGRRQIPSLGYPSADFRMIQFTLVRKIHIDNHFPDIVEQAGHETEILLLDLRSLCNQCRCLCRRERVFPELDAVFPALPDRCANERA